MFPSQIYIADTLACMVAVQAECLALVLIAAPPILDIWPLVVARRVFLTFKIITFFNCFSSLTHKHETGTIKGQNLLIANHLDQSIYQGNHKQVLECEMTFCQA
jgi:hypothetical protein